MGLNKDVKILYNRNVETFYYYLYVKEYPYDRTLRKR